MFASSGDWGPHAKRGEVWDPLERAPTCYQGSIGIEAPEELKTNTPQSTKELQNKRRASRNRAVFGRLEKWWWCGSLMQLTRSPSSTPPSINREF